MSCDPLATTSLGKAFVVTDYENCPKELTQTDGGNYPSIVMVLSPDEVLLRDGSSSQPIQLPHLQQQILSSFNRIVIIDGGGTLKAGTPTAYCVQRKLIADAGNFHLVPDILPEIIEGEICEVDSCDDIDYIIGLKEIDLSSCLVGEFFELVKIPKSLCPTCAEPTE
jgi:hypothetical protein